MSTSLPNSDSGSVVSGQIDYGDITPVYLLRLTPLGRYTIIDVINELDTYGNDLVSWVIGEEGDITDNDKYHMHLVLEYGPDGSILRDKWKAFIYKYWEPHERRRGFGNKQYNLQRSLDPIRGLTYALKLGRYRCSDTMDMQLVKYCESQSFTKNPITEFRRQFKLLMQKYSSEDTAPVIISAHIRSFMIEFSDLKAEYGQQVRMQDAYGYALSTLIKRDPSQTSAYVEYFLNRF